MPSVRHILQRHPVLLAGLLLGALLMRLLVPAGYMPAAAGGGIALALCPGTMPAEPMAATMPGMHHGEHAPGKHAPDKHSRADQPCAYAGLAAPVLGAADPALLAAALAFAFLLAITRIASVPPTRRVRLRPPLRAPPPPA